MKTTNCTIAQLHNAQFISVNGISPSSPLQHGGRPGGVARYLVAKMSRSWGGKDGDTFGGDGQDAAFGECEEPVALSLYACG